MDGSNLNPSPLEQGHKPGCTDLAPRLSWLGPLLIIAAALLLIAARI